MVFLSNERRTIIIIVIISMSGTKVFTIIISNINSDAFDFSSFVYIYFVYILVFIMRASWKISCIAKCRYPR